MNRKPKHPNADQEICKKATEQPKEKLNHSTTANEIWRLPKVLMVTGMGKSWIYAAIKEGAFPAPVKLGRRAVGWKRIEVEDWISNRSSDYTVEG